MKILIVAASMPQAGEKPGGVAVVVSELSLALKNLGHDVSIASNSPTTETNLIPRVPILPFLSGFFKKFPQLTKNRLVTLILTPLALNFLSTKAYDVLILNGDDWFYFLRSKPTLRIMHGSALREAQYAQSWLRKILQYFVYPLEKLSSLLATRTIAISEETKNIYPKAHSVVPNGYDVKSFYPAEEKSIAPFVLFVGTWGGRKRGSFLYNEFKNKILKEHPDAELHLVVDRAIDEEKIKSYAAISPAELGALYRKAWVFAYPSLYEGFGIPYIEAMASGTYVVASSCAASESLLSDASLGQVVSDERFAQKVIDKISEFKNKGFNKADKTIALRYSWPNVAELYERHLKELIEERGA